MSGITNDQMREVVKTYIESKATPKGGYTKEMLTKFGVAWPPVKGWKEKLIEDVLSGKWQLENLKYE